MQTAGGLYNAVRHPLQTGQAIWSGIVNKWNSGNAGKGELAFDAVASVLGAIKAAGEIKNLAKLGRLVDDAGEEGGKLAEKAAGEVGGPREVAPGAVEAPIAATPPAPDVPNGGVLPLPDPWPS